MARQAKIRILIGDHRPIIRAGLRRLLSKDGDFLIVGEAEDGPQLLKRVRDLKPAVLLMEGLLAGGVESEFEVLRELQRKQKGLHVIALTSSDREEEVMRSVRRSLAAVLPKRTVLSVLIECIRRVASGETWPDAPVAASFGGSATGLFASTSPSLDSSPLSDRATRSLQESRVGMVIADGECRISD